MPKALWRSSCYGRVRESEILFKAGYDQPLDVLALFCERILNSEELLQDFVREVDAEWGANLSRTAAFPEGWPSARSGRPVHVFVGSQNAIRADRKTARRLPRLTLH